MTTYSRTGAIIFEHIYEDNNGELVIVVNTEPKPTKQSSNMKYIYTSYARPTRAANYNNVGEQWVGNDSVVEIVCR